MREKIGKLCADLDAANAKMGALKIQHNIALENMGKSLGKVADQRDQLQQRVDRLTDGIKGVSILMAESEGVSGLHLNGDIAPWDELLEGGRFEEWLLNFSSALAALADSGEAK